MVIGLTTLFRIRVIDTPLERDEGEYAYIAQGFLLGMPPYSDAMTMKLPGVPALYALAFALLGQTVEAVHWALIFASATTAVLMFLMARDSFSDSVAVAASAVFAFSAPSSVVLGFSANSEAFAIPFVVSGWWAIQRYQKRTVNKDLILSGIALGLAIVCKQQCLPFLAGATLIIVLHRPSRARRLLPALALFASGPTLLLVTLALSLKIWGTWDPFVEWVIKYPRSYVSQLSWNDVAANAWHIVPRIGIVYGPLIVLGAIGLVWPRLGTLGTSEIRSFRVFALAALLSVSIGFHFREHYFLLGLPALSIGVAVWTSSQFTKGRKPYGCLVLASAIAWCLLADFGTYCSASPGEISAAAYGTNPFLESQEIARVIVQETESNEQVLILGSEPQVLFLAERRSAVPYIYMYPLTEAHPAAQTFQDDLIQRIEARPPRAVVLVEIGASWLFREKSSRRILAWMAERLPDLYEKRDQIPVIRNGAHVGEVSIFVKRALPIKHSLH